MILPIHNFLGVKEQWSDSDPEAEGQMTWYKNMYKLPLIGQTGRGDCTNEERYVVEVSSVVWFWAK